VPGSLFVDRETELSQLDRCALQAGHGAGLIVMVEGDAGIGKTALLNTFAGHALGTYPRGTVLTVSCHAEVGPIEAYGPFIDLLTLIDETRPKPRLRRFTRRAAQRAPDLLEVVPTLGPLLKFTAETVAGAIPGAPLADPRTAARAVAEAALRALRRYTPAIIIIDDVHRIDASSCAVISYLAEMCAQRPIMMVLVARGDELADNSTACRLVDDLHVRGSLPRLRLGGLPDDAVADFGLLTMGVPMSAPDAADLARRTGGHPLTLRYYLAEQLAQPASPGAASTTLLPATVPQDEPASIFERVATLIRIRMRRLDEDDRRLLSIAAVHGEQFLSAVVAQVAGLDADIVATRLHRMAVDTGLILAAGVNDWAGSDRYRFEHSLLWQVLYNDQGHAQRRSRHQRIAAILEDMGRGKPDPPQEVVLETVLHHRAGGDRLAAALSAYRAACTLAATGASTREVAAICREGLDDVRQVPPAREVSRLRAQLIELLLAASELDWAGQPRAGEVNSVEELAREAIAAADEAGDDDLRVRVRYLYGKVLVYTRGLGEALGPLREAWQTALTSGDPVSQLLAGCEYGRQLPKVDVAGGLDVLRRTHHLARHEPTLQASDDPVITRARDMVGLQLGVNLFDAGQLGEALTLLRDGVAQIRDRGALGLLSIGLNYLVQVELATGADDEAERLLREAITLTDGTDGDAWHAVNLATLGWLIVVRHHDPAGIPLLEQAREQSSQRWQANLAPLVANLYAAALLHVADSAAYTMAQRVLEETVEETRRTGMLRSEVTALSLLAQMRLAQGEPGHARDASDQAVAHLQRAGWKLAAVCVEDVLYHHGVILRASGDIDGADEALSRARAEVDAKAQSLEPEARARYLNEVPINQLIIG
jgi:tetratricopeptide (TPR) repeat protein